MPSVSRVRVQSTSSSPIGQIQMWGHFRGVRYPTRRPLRVLGSYAVVYVLAGSGRYRDADGRSAELHAGDLLTVFPDVPHIYGPTEGTTWTEIFLVFSGPVFDLWRRTALLPETALVRHLEPIDTWAAAFDSVLGAAPPSGSEDALVSVCRLQSLLAEAFASSTAEVSASEQRWLARAIALLDADPRREVALEDVAGQLSISYDGFRKRFRRLAGVSPARYRTARAIDRACELMAQGRLTNREIAATLGFCDEAHFSHRFKEITGTTARSFRASMPVRRPT